MKKINFYTTDFLMGGLENTLINVVSELKGEYDIQIYTLLKTRKVFENQRAITRMTRKSGFVQKVLGFITILFYKPRKADVHINWDTYNKYLSRICLKQQGKKVIWVHSNLEKSNRTKFINLCRMKKFDKIVAVSDDSLNALTNQGLKNTTRIYNLIDNKFASSSRKEKKYDFVNVSRHVNDHKDIKKYIDIARSNKDKKFVQVGNGVDYDENISYAKDLSNIEFVGEKDSLQFVLESKSFLLTSKVEGFGIVLLEALASGCDVYATNCVEDYKNDYWSKYIGFIDKDNNLISAIPTLKFNYSDYKESVVNQIKGIVEE